MFQKMTLEVLFLSPLLTGVVMGADATLEQSLLAEDASALAAAAKKEGDPLRGAVLFFQSKLSCATCHSVSDRAGSIGPDLTLTDKKTPDVDLVEAILLPSKKIATAYTTISVKIKEGRLLSGMLVEENAEKLVLREGSQPDKLITLKKDEIVKRVNDAISLMPAGQVNLLDNRKQFLDLVSYMIALRDGGAEKARELSRAMQSIVRAVPDKPTATKPVVQRGELALAEKSKAKFPRAVAIGFPAGTIVFDADQLATVAAWQDEFVKNSPQNYFGLYWQQSGSSLDDFSANPNPLSFKLPGTEWQNFESPVKSDPNVGSRFDGYQIGMSSVRLHYRVLVGNTRVSVIEDVRAESRTDCTGYIRKYQFSGLPAGAQVSLTLPEGEKFQRRDLEGKEVGAGDDLNAVPLLAYRSGDVQRVVRAQSAGANWLGSDKSWKVVSAPAKDQTPVELRIDMWKFGKSKAAVSAAELTALHSAPPVLADDFAAAVKPPVPLPPLPAPAPAVETVQAPVPPRPPVNSKENIDEFKPAAGKFLRFVINQTNDNTSPGLDELEVYGADDKLNLALKAKASASSCIAGYPIHQIPHLNDGKLGNSNSWISAENGGWVQLEFPEAVEMRKIVWARDRTGVSKDRLPTGYRIEVSSDGKAWTKVGDESGRVGKAMARAVPGYLIEDIPTPFKGCRPSDIAFTADGVMYAIAMTEGEVWRTRTPPPGHPDLVQWTRYAAGLYHPIGIAVINSRVFIAQKPEVTELIDRDGDGTVDHFRTVATGWGLSTGWHEYCFGLGVDPQNNLWIALNTGYFWTNPGYVNPGRWRGSVLRIQHDTEKLEEVAKGFRVPNGITQGPGGDMFITDNQGDWIQVCKLAHVQQGRFYGHPEYKENALPEGKYPDGHSAVWMPYQRSKSTSGPVFDKTEGKFGAFDGQAFVGDVGYGANTGLMRIALEKVEGEYQGAIFPFIDGYPLGCERLKFGPDNSLYAASLTTGLTRLTYTGKSNPMAMQSMNIRHDGKGFTIRFTKPLAADSTPKPADIKVKRFHYLYTGNYGSPQAEETPVPVQSVELSQDRTTLTLSLPVQTYPIGMVYEFNVGAVTADDGEKLGQTEAWYTVYNIPKATP